MSIKKKMPELEHVAIVDGDSKQYPAVDLTGYYTSMDIVKIFDEIKWSQRAFYIKFYDLANDRLGYS